MTTSTVMNEGFQPTRRGRRPLVDINEFVPDIISAKGMWVRFIITPAQARSVSRQLTKRGGIEVAMEAVTEDETKLYARTA